MKLRSGVVLAIAALMMTLQSSCGVYSFTGGSICPEAKTVSIAFFENVSGAGPSNLSIRFTEALRTYFQQNTKLTLVPQNGDLHLEGTIVTYQVSPLSPSGNNVAAQNRLLMSVNVNFRSICNEGKDDFENQAFSFYFDYLATQTLGQVEEEAVTLLSNQISLDIYTRTVANW